MRPALALPIGLVAVALTATPAGAQAPTPSATATREAPPRLALQLEIALGPGARRCPGEEMLHREVARRIGYDPFNPEEASTPADRLTVTIAGSDDELRATYTWITPDGRPRWAKPKTYAEDGQDASACTHIFEGIATEIQWEFPMPSHHVQPAPVQAVPAPVCAPAAAVPECVKVAPVGVEAEKPEPMVVVARPASVPRVWRIEAGPWVDFGLAPTPMAGVKVEGGVWWRRWAVAAQLRWGPAGSVGAQNAYSRTGVSTRLLAAGLSGCVHGEWHVSFAGCVLAEVGQLQRTSGSNVYNDVRQAAPYAGGGVGAHLAMPLPAHFYAAVAADVRGVTMFVSGPGHSADWLNTGNVAGIAGGIGAGVGVAF